MAYLHVTPRQTLTASHCSTLVLAGGGGRPISTALQGQTLGLALKRPSAMLSVWWNSLVSIECLPFSGVDKGEGAKKNRTWGFCSQIFRGEIKPHRLPRASDSVLLESVSSPVTMIVPTSWHFYWGESNIILYICIYKIIIYILYVSTSYQYDVIIYNIII